MAIKPFVKISRLIKVMPSKNVKLDKMAQEKNNNKGIIFPTKLGKFKLLQLSLEKRIIMGKLLTYKAE